MFPETKQSEWSLRYDAAASVYDRLLLSLALTETGEPENFFKPDNALIKLKRSHSDYLGHKPNGNTI